VAALNAFLEHLKHLKEQRSSEDADKTYENAFRKAIDDLEIARCMRACMGAWQRADRLPST
jgi:hypothetical protein